MRGGGRPCRRPDSCSGEGGDLRSLPEVGGDVTRQRPARGGRRPAQTLDSEMGPTVWRPGSSRPPGVLRTQAGGGCFYLHPPLPLRVDTDLRSVSRTARIVSRDVGERDPRPPRRGAPGRSRVWNITSDSWLRCPRDRASAASTPSLVEYVPLVEYVRLWWSIFSLVEYVCLEPLSGGVCQAKSLSSRSGGVCHAS